jgi:hypothetical protein
MLQGEILFGLAILTVKSSSVFTFFARERFGGEAGVKADPTVFPSCVNVDVS